MCIFNLKRRQYRVTELHQTFHTHRHNTCSFVFCGAKFYGEGHALNGIHKTLSNKHYKWTIFDEQHRQLFTFGTDDANTPICKRKLSRWMRESIFKN